MYSICAECGSQVLDLALHMKIHNDKRSFECEVCGKVTFGKKGFLNHQQTHKSWSCPKCQAVLPHNSRTMHLKKCAKEGPPDPLHVNLLGCGNDVLECLEKFFPLEIQKFYKEHNLKKSGEGPGGKFNGPSIKFILREENLCEFGFQCGTSN